MKCAVCPKPITDEHDYITLIRYDIPERIHIHQRCFLRTNDLSRVWDSVIKTTEQTYPICVDCGDAILPYWQSGKMRYRTGHVDYHAKPTWRCQACHEDRRDNSPTQASMALEAIA